MGSRNESLDVGKKKLYREGSSECGSCKGGDDRDEGSEMHGKDWMSGV